MGIRFHVVVFNYERISSFLDNFDKIHNFRADRDRLVVLDCSVNHDQQARMIADLADKRGWAIGKEVEIVRRRNWGIDQGARIDYFASLRKRAALPSFIWQFQEHYLDLESPWSIWPSDMPRIGGQLKADTLPDGVVIDLDFCERVYLENPSVSVIYADRDKVGIFAHPDGREWFYADGANFSVRTADVLEAFPADVLSTYRSIYDGSYDWTLFMELDICRRLNRPDREWYDLVTNESFRDPEDLRAREGEKRVSLHQDAEAFYSSLYRAYEERFESFSNKCELRRRLQITGSSLYLSAVNSSLGRGAKAAIDKAGIGNAARQLRRYLVNLPRD
ncbi:MAG TPA: hypothetical protein VFR78_23280 [Pyrinomonadaceae bacterium]|nr:hypothetical protein [Pyrinomonadaceae bacterium]